MTDLDEVTIDEVELHLNKHRSNILFDNYELPSICLRSEIKCYRAKIESSDMHKLYLVGNFHQETNGTCRLIEIDKDEVINRKDENRSVRLANLMSGGKDFKEGIDLFEDSDFEPVLFGKDLANGGFVFIDGSHRAIAHFITYGTLVGVSVFICVHSNMVNYRFYKHLP